MSDLSAAIAAAREALAKYQDREVRHYLDEAMEGLLAALDAAQGEADMVAMFQHDETGRTTCVPASEAADFARLNPRWERIGSGLAPQAPPAAARDTVDAIAAALDEWLGPLNEADTARACEAICKAMVPPAAVPAGWGLFVDGRLSGHYESEYEARRAASEIGCEVRQLLATNKENNP